MKAAAEALTPGVPGRPKLSDETRRIRQLEAEKKRLKNELYEMKAISELQGRIIAIRNSQLAEREKKRGLHGNLWVNQREIHQNPSSVKRQSGITAPVGRFYSVCRLTAART